MTAAIVITLYMNNNRTAGGNTSSASDHSGWNAGDLEDLREHHGYKPKRDCLSFKESLPSAAIGQLLDEYLAWCFSNETAPRADELAARAGMSRSAFSRRYKKICGVSPSRALKQAQLRYVQSLMGTGRDLTTLAYAAGFGSRRSIFRSFRREMGATPGAIRTQLLENRRPVVGGVKQ